MNLENKNEFSITDFLTKMSRIGIIKKFFLENKLEIKSQSEQNYCIENNLVFFNHKSTIFKIFFEFLKRQNNSYKNQKSDTYQLILLTFPEIRSNKILFESSFFFLLPKKIEKHDPSKNYSELAYLFIFKNDLCYYYQFPFGSIGFITYYWFDSQDYANFDHDNLVLTEDYRDISNQEAFYQLILEETSMHNLPIKYLSKNILFENISRIETLNRIENEIETLKIKIKNLPERNFRKSYSRHKNNLENLIFWKHLIKLPLEMKYIIFDYLNDDWSRLL